MPQPGPASGGPLVLDLGGASIVLTEGALLPASHVPGLQPSSPGGAVAEVSRNPSHPDVLGLRNLSLDTWAVVLADGGRRSIAPGQTARLDAGAVFTLGSLQARVQAAAPPVGTPTPPIRPPTQPVTTDSLTIPSSAGHLPPICAAPTPVPPYAGHLGNPGPPLASAGLQNREVGPVQSQCSQCGNPVNPNSPFCNTCGTPAQAVSQGAPLRPAPTTGAYGAPHPPGARPGALPLMIVGAVVALCACVAAVIVHSRAGLQGVYVDDITASTTITFDGDHACSIKNDATDVGGASGPQSLGYRMDGNNFQVYPLTTGGGDATDTDPHTKALYRYFQSQTGFMAGTVSDDRKSLVFCGVPFSRR